MKNEYYVYSGKMLRECELIFHLFVNTLNIKIIVLLLKETENFNQKYGSKVRKPFLLKLMAFT